jgi:hypothetical protein
LEKSERQIFHPKFTIQDSADPNEGGLPNVHKILIQNSKLQNAITFSEQNKKGDFLLDFSQISKLYTMK